MSEQQIYRDSKIPSFDKEEEYFHDLLHMALNVQHEMKELKNLIEQQQHQKEIQPLLYREETNGIEKKESVSNIRECVSDLLTTQEVMQWLKLSKRTIQKYRDSKKIPFREFNGKVYYLRHEIEACFIEFEISNKA